ncbi:tripartite tricarboxylate transporter substrate-binding protein [Massilia sp. S19_KUP03_FR1]|uniref:tripartite tricarboxylate transporter substrate-binding protein n=1 Tax=Massilia sp. S19_KUP03_FR1 TaxID=3025503 RepID=UPI002FCD6EB1
MIHQQFERRRALRLLGALALAAQMPSSAAQGAPDGRRARILVGLPPGGTGTKIGDGMAKALGQQRRIDYVLEHLQGKDGRRVVDELRRAPPDGGTLLVAQSSLVTVYPSIYKDLGFAPKTDLTPLAVIADYTFMLVVGPRVPPEVKSFDNYLEWLTENPAFRQIGVTSRGGEGWLIGQQMGYMKDAPLQVVAYSGAGPIISDLLGGALAAGIFITGNAANARAAGRIRALAVSSEERWPGLPETPTFIELGLSQIKIRGWYGLFGQASLDNARRRALSDDVEAALNSGGMLSVIKELSMQSSHLDARHIADRIDSETAYFAEAVRMARLERI